MLCASLITKLSMDLIISYLLGANGNLYENVTCKENIFFNLGILNP